MEAFKWNKHFITDLEKVDTQHKHLVSLVNILGTMVLENNFDEISIINILEDLVEYTTYHFKEELEMMLHFNINKKHISKHLVVHSSFINDIGFMSSKELGNIEESTKYLFEYLMHWLAYHILGMDQEMSNQIKMIKQGISPDDAYRMVIESQSNITEPLLNALKGLFKQVSQKNEKLITLNKNLENKVIERTKELSDLNIKLENISYTDILTGIKNRRYAIESLIDIWDRSNDLNLKLSCLMIDIDNFKSVNDIYGHDVGDNVIKIIANTLQSSTPPPNIVCRLGRDEFIILCPDLDSKDSILLSEKILNNVSSLKIKTGDCFWNGSVSIGISTKSQEIKDYEELIKAADINVYEAKRAGKNCYKC